MQDKYYDIAKSKLIKLLEKESFIILAIESSCDETAAAVVKGREVLSNIIVSQIDIHKEYGGVVPEIASRNHTVNIERVIDEAINQAGVALSDIEAVAVTYGAGLQGALLVGISYAKALAYSLKVPLIGVNHIKGHIAANYITHKSLEPPFIALIASGGHTSIVNVIDYDSFDIIGKTEDDACGEAFDKVARVLNLPYPGGPAVEKLAEGTLGEIPMPRPFKNESHYNFSYSGLKTAVINYVNNAKARGDEIDKKVVAYSFMKTAIGMLVENSIRAALSYNVDKLVVAGGVGANKLLRNMLNYEGEKNNIKVFYPKLSLCTDNAAMIGCAAHYLVKTNKINALCDLSLDADPSLRSL